MSSFALSPARTPSRSGNVERLLSLQKSSKHLSDADILSFAVEASAMKRVANASQNNENSNPNSKTGSSAVSKRLFDIGQCSKSAMGSAYSPDQPEKPLTESPEEDLMLAEQDNDDDEEDQLEAEEIAVEERVERILDIVNSAAKKRTERQGIRRTTAAAKRAEVRQQGQEIHEQEQTEFGSEYYGADVADTIVDDTDMGSFSQDAVTAAVEGGSIREMVVARILSILNTGTYEEILSLHAIGQVRALRVLTARNTGSPFQELQDLQQVGMNDKQIARFLSANAAAFVAV